jgi:hypothetical protein
MKMKILMWGRKRQDKQLWGKDGYRATWGQPKAKNIAPGKNIGATFSSSKADLYGSRYKDLSLGARDREVNN